MKQDYLNLPKEIVIRRARTIHLILDSIKHGNGNEYQLPRCSNNITNKYGFIGVYSNSCILREIIGPAHSRHRHIDRIEKIYKNYINIIERRDNKKCTTCNTPASICSTCPYNNKKEEGK